MESEQCQHMREEHVQSGDKMIWLDCNDLAAIKSW